jgi:isoquinoline 1-oxidoreductase
MIDDAADRSEDGAPDVERYELVESARYRFDPDRREFIRIFGLLGAGLAVIARPTLAGQESGRGRRGAAPPDEISAWLHVGEDGRITAYTGKVEIGQNIRTSLAQTVAGELRVPLRAVTMLMGDTDLTPYDAGTFGSQTTPRMAPQLAKAAAAAREMLVARAASAWAVDPHSLTVADGLISDAAGRTVAYGALTKGQQLTGTVRDTPDLTPASKWTVRGAAPKKADGRDFVTGRHEFTPDVVRPGMLYGRIIRAPGYTGTLESVDDAQARGMAGTVIVRDGDFLGVAAPTERAAIRAAKAIRTRWRPPTDQPSSTTIYDYFKAHEEGGGRGGPSVKGDVARARAGAAKTFDASYRIPYIAHVPLEPRAAVAEWEGGKLTVWCGTQRPFGVRSQLAEAFQMPESRVRVIVPDTGSAYGGKHTGEHAIEAARLARAARKPVKLVWTRAEEFSYGYFRPAGVIDVRAAADENGRLVAWEFDNWNSGGSGIATPYDIPNERIAFHATASPLRQGSYRGLAATANHYVREMHMDEVARALGIDAVAFRERHLSDERLRAVLKAAAERIGWPKPSVAGRSLGIACGTEKASYVATAAEVSSTADGFRVHRLAVAFECGAIVNPDGLRNQVEGAVVQGLGGALFEAIEFADGAILNGSMARYRVPRFKDVPAIDIVLIDRKDIPSAGAGETPIVCVAPAIGSAVRAFGRVARGLPVKMA